MKKDRAIPAGYMTVGEVAKKTNTTVRTLQYYDKEGVLSPSEESEGGRRLYTNKDIVKLYQIQAMKFLGFSLDDIKNRLPKIDTHEEVSAVLKEQAKGIRESISSLKHALNAVEKLSFEVLQMKSVDWAQYANIVGMLHAKNPGYWLIKHMDTSVMEHFTAHLDAEVGEKLNEKYIQIIKKSATIQNAGHAPNSAEAMALAKEWWDFVMATTAGDSVLLAKLIEMGQNVDYAEWTKKYSFDKDYLEEILDNYFAKLGYNPLESEGKND